MACFEVDILFGFDPCRTAFGHESKQDIGLGLCCGFCAWSCAWLGLFASQRAVVALARRGAPTNRRVIGST